MQKFFVLYMAPAEVVSEWMKKPEEERKKAEGAMRADWNSWAALHADALIETMALGGTKRVTKEGVADVKNDMMLYSIVEAETPESAAEMFKNHPHFGISGASIEIMPISSLS